MAKVSTHLSESIRSQRASKIIISRNRLLKKLKHGKGVGGIPWIHKLVDYHSFILLVRHSHSFWSTNDLHCLWYFLKIQISGSHHRSYLFSPTYSVTSLLLDFFPLPFHVLISLIIHFC